MEALRGHIAEKLGKALKVTGDAGRSTSFEITINGQEIYSKLKEGSFPDFDDVVRAIEEYRKSGKITAVKKQEGGGCLIM